MRNKITRAAASAAEIKRNLHIIIAIQCEDDLRCNPLQYLIFKTNTYLSQILGNSTVKVHRGHHIPAPAMSSIDVAHSVLYLCCWLNDSNVTMNDIANVRSTLAIVASLLLLLASSSTRVIRNALSILIIYHTRPTRRTPPRWRDCKNFPFSNDRRAKKLRESLETRMYPFSHLKDTTITTPY